MSEVDRGRAAWNYVSSLGSALQSGENSLGTVPGLVKRILLEDLWREFTPPGAVEPVRPRDFADFVTAHPTDGLGATLELIKRMAGDDMELLDLLDQALQGKQGFRTDLVDNIHKVDRPSGTSESAALRRLRKDRPDLHAKVLDGELSTHAAAIEAGFRPKTFTVRADRAEAIAATLRRQLDPATFRDLADLLARIDTAAPTRSSVEVE